MPGFGFSDKPAATGWGVERIARGWIALMEALGYGDRWAAQGGDWGSAMIETISRMRPAGLVGMHANFPRFVPTPDEIAAADIDEKAMIADIARTQQLSAYLPLQSTRPQSIGFALADSPIGQAAWILQLFKDGADCGGRPLDHFSLDELIDDIMIYWLPNAGASSARLYWEEAQNGGFEQSTPLPNDIPFGFSMFPKEVIRASLRWLQRRYTNVKHYQRASRGGHFAAMENPQELADAIRATFKSLR
jgi:pimeloyl-ACP methyl ester carboxylesterase